MADPQSLDFIVNRKQWSEHHFEEGPAPGDLAAGQVLFRVDRFAFTANNISYALAGDMLRYWDFFPAREGCGRIPTMGFGDVVASRHPEVAEGTRCFGFYPMSRYLVIEPSHATATQIVDGVAHRQGLAPAYNQYSPAKADALYAADREDPLMLMRGLFMTSFLAEDFLAESSHHGARQVLITSASSKTSIALAFVVAQRGSAKAVGLTSARNLDFVRQLGFYDEVRLYEDVASLSADEPTVLVDMAGDATVNAAAHRHFGDALRYHCNIGATHWDARAAAPDEGLPGAKPEFFFAPGQIQKRSQDWGPEGLQERLGGAWGAFCDASDAWLRVVRGYGREAVEQVYLDTLAGRTRPAEGHVISLWDDEAAAGGR